MKILNAALAAMAVLTVPAVAQAADRENISVNIVSSDLDLTTPEGVNTLRQRVDLAIAKACNPGDRLNADMKPDWQCRKEMGVHALDQMAALRQNAGHLATN